MIESQVKRFRVPISVAACCLAMACGDQPTTAPTSTQSTLQPDIAAIEANVEDSLSLFVSFSAPNADSVRAVITSIQTGDSTLTITRKVQQGRFSLLGLKPRTPYRVVIEAWKGAERSVSPEHIVATGGLPGAIQLARLDLLDGARPATGYILAPMVTPTSSYLVIFDNSGRLVWYRDFGQVPLVEAKQQPNGNYTVFLGATRGWDKVAGQFDEVDRTGAIVRTWQAPAGYYTDSHEIQIRTENGQTVAYFFGYNFHSAEGLSGYNPGDSIAGHQLFRVTAAGQATIVEDAWQEFSTDEMLEPPLPSGDFDHPNALHFDADGNYIISYRVLGTVVKVDKTTGHVVWRLGGLKSDFTFVNDPEGGFSAQHDAQMLDNGNILLFDNGWRHSPQASRAAEYKLDLNAMTATLVWSYSHSPSTFTAYTGSVQRMTDGSTLIGFSGMNTMVQVDANGKFIGEFRPMINDDTSSGFYRVVGIKNLFRYEPL